MTSPLIHETIEDMNPLFDNHRPLSWSSLSTFDGQYGSPEKWYKKYILGHKDPTTPELTFGKLVADSFQTDKPLAPVTLYSDVEKKLSVKFDGIPLVGYLDTYDSETHSFREFKTSKKLWTRAKAQSHGQLKFYALMLYCLYKVKPEDYTIFLDNILTKDSGDFAISFVEPIKIYSIQVKLTMSDILTFGRYLKKVYKEMQEYSPELSPTPLASISPQV